MYFLNQNRTPLIISNSLKKLASNSTIMAKFNLLHLYNFKEALFDPKKINSTFAFRKPMVEWPSG
jgi:hypothetical protein